MGSKRRIRRNACTNKVRYATSDEARTARRSTQQRNARRGNFGPMGVYKCRWCGGFHIGHVPHKVIELRQRIMEGDYA